MIVFRVDASQEIGAGHVMRCLTFANTFSANDHACRFICRHMPEYIIEKLISDGHQVVVLPKIANSEVDELAHSDWLGCNQLLDAEATLQAISDTDVDWLIVDHYGLDLRWEMQIKPYVNQLMVIDDLADRSHLCEVILDQNYYENMHERYSSLVPDNCIKLFGPKYALLRPEFHELRKSITSRNGIISKVLVSFGGVDVKNYTEPAIEALKSIKGIQSVNVVIGDQHPAKKIIIDKCESYGFLSHLQTERMGELIRESDFAIGASGSSTWERCCLGLPSLVIPIAGNQQAIAVGAKKLAVHDLLEINVDAKREIYARLIELQMEQKYLSELSINGMNAVDGFGSNRVIESLG